eukprot:874978-Amphidinium_carterae.1
MKHMRVMGCHSENVCSLDALRNLRLRFRSHSFDTLSSLGPSWKWCFVARKPPTPTQSEEPGDTLGMSEKPSTACQSQKH